jgi:hypothetical protein
MEIETLKPRLHNIMDHLSSGCSLRDIDLPALIASLKQSPTWTKGEISTLILLKSPEKKIILAAIHEGTEIESFQSNDSVMLQVLEGRLRFHNSEDTVTLDEGQLMTFDENVKYTLTTLEETVILLTISGSIPKASFN